MQRQLPEPAPLARTRRLLAALPSGLPTSSACVLAAALVIAPVITARAILLPDDRRGDGIPAQIEGGAASGRHLPDPSVAPECATRGGQCAVPHEAAGQHTKAQTDGAANQSMAAVALAPTTPAVVAPGDPGADQETATDGSPSADDAEREANGASLDRGHAGGRGSTDRHAGEHAGDHGSADRNRDDPDGESGGNSDHGD